MLFRSIATGGLLVIPELIFWVRELKGAGGKSGKSYHVTVAQLRWPGHVLFVYRSLQLLTQEINSLSPVMMVLAHTAAIGFAVAASVSLIRFHGHISVFLQLAMLALLMLTIGFLGCSHIMLGEISRLSRAVLQSWAHNHALREMDRQLMTRYVRSCPVLKFEIGKYGHFQRVGALRNTGRIVTYSVRVILIF